MSKNVVLEKVFKGVGVSEKSKEIIEGVLNIIPEEAWAVLKDKEEFLIVLKKILEEYHDKIKRKDVFAGVLAEELLSRLNLREDVFGKEVWRNPQELLFLSSLVYAGYLKLDVKVPLEYRNLEIRNIAFSLAYIIKKYRSLENLEERMKETEEVKRLHSSLIDSRLSCESFFFFIEKAYKIKVETFDGNPPEPNLINIKNAKEINEAISLRPFDVYERRGAKIVEALKTEFPFTKQVLDNVSYEFLLLLGAYTKEEFIEAFGKNYMDLKRRMVKGLEEHPSVVAATLNRTLFNQKDLFFGGIYDIAIPPSFPIQYAIPGGTLIVKNGYEDLAYCLICELPYPADWVFSKRYKDKMDLYIASVYYTYVKGLKHQKDYQESNLNKVLDAIEKNLTRESRAVLEVWL